MDRNHLPLWVSITILICAIGAVGTNALLLSPLVQSVGSDLGVLPERVMRAASGYGLGVAAAALLLAPLGDRMGAGRLLRLALVVLTIGFLCSAAAPSLMLLTAAQVLCGIAGGAALPSIYTLAAVIAPKGREARVMGAVLTGWTLSLVVGVSAGAWAADMIGWRAVYLGLGIMSATLWLSTANLARLPSPTGRASSPLSAFRVAGMGRGLFATFGLMLGFYISYCFMGAHATQALGLSTAQAGLIPLLYGLGFGSAVLFDPTLDKLGLARATPPIFAIVAVVYLLMAALAQNYVLFLGSTVLWGVFQHLALNLLVARLTALDPVQRGAIMGLYSAATYLCVFVAPLLGGLLFAAFGILGCLVVSSTLTASEAFEALSMRRKMAQPQSGPQPATEPSL